MDEQRQKLIETLIRFIERVCKGDCNSESEVYILPEIVRELRLLAFEN